MREYLERKTGHPQTPPLNIRGPATTISPAPSLNWNGESITGIQAKLEVGEPNDIYEQESNRVARQVMHMPEPQSPPVQSKPIPTSPIGQPAAPAIIQEVLDSPGQSLDSGAQSFFEPRFGYDLSNIRLHTDARAAASTQAVNAAAYTVGNNIVFGKNQYQPASSPGRALIAHELTHVMQQTTPQTGIGPSYSRVDTNHVPVSLRRSPALQRLTDQHGQHVSGGQADLTADLTSPLVAGSVVRFQSRWGYVPTVGTGPIRYYWAIHERDTNNLVVSSTSDYASASLRFSSVGHFRVVHQLLVDQRGTGAIHEGGRLVGSVSMDFDVVAESSEVAGQSSEIRELVNDFRNYIIASATNTGPQGITPLFLASVLRKEIENTAPLPYMSSSFFRHLEAGTVASAINARESGQDFDPSDINRSVGVGQIRLSTAAMLFGDIPWQEQDRTMRWDARRRIRRDYDALRTGAQRDILTQLRWPKSNIDVAARLLDHLKNRTHRYPGMTRAAFGTHQRAIEIIASEYNGGPTDTPESDAGANYYGREMWTYMQEEFMQNHFPNS
jgi:Domain of unknown function (DUF4157)